jgi:GGDEF domain-containing protein
VSLVRVVSQEQKTMHYIAFLKDITEKLAATSVSRNWPIATLTGLPNRVLLHERIDFSLGLCSRAREFCHCLHRS